MNKKAKRGAQEEKTGTLSMTKENKRTLKKTRFKKKSGQKNRQLLIVRQRHSKDIRKKKVTPNGRDASRAKRDSNPHQNKKKKKKKKKKKRTVA